MAIDQEIYFAADCVVLTRQGEVLLIQRGNAPFQGKWAFPGGFIETNEEMETAAARELHEETGLVIEPGELELVFIAGKCGRDPRFRTVSVVYLKLLEQAISVQGGDDAAQAKWFPLDALPDMAFDHLEILKNILKERSLFPDTAV